MGYMSLKRWPQLWLTQCVKTKSTTQMITRWEHTYWEMNEAKQQEHRYTDEMKNNAEWWWENSWLCDTVVEYRLSQFCFEHNDVW